MAKFQGGLVEMIKAISLLDAQEREKLLKNIALKDPKMAQEIEARLYSLEDLLFLSPQMLSAFLREISVSDLALGLKLYEEAFRQEFYQKLPSSLVRDLKDQIENTKVPKSKANESHQKVVLKIKNLVDQGKLIIRKNDRDID